MATLMVLVPSVWLISKTSNDHPYSLLFIVFK
nr:MAG TPA: hypothetical protein [Caudoviricetes sp.]